MKKSLALLLALLLALGSVGVAALAAEDKSVVKYFPLHGDYQFNDILNSGDALVPPGDGNAIVTDDYLSLHRNDSAGNPDNTGHLVSNMPGAKITGDEISFSFNCKVDLNQSRTPSDDEAKIRTIFMYGSSDYGKNCVTLRYYYSDNTSALVLVQGGSDAVVAAFPRPVADMWHNYSIAIDGKSGGKVTVYVDGEEAASVDSKGIGADEIGADVLRINRANTSSLINVDTCYRNLRFIKGIVTAAQAKDYTAEIGNLTWKELQSQTYVTDGMVIRDDLTLPAASGISWSSSDSSVIDGATGKVNRPAYGEAAKDVTLTLNWKGNQKSYKVTVLPIDAGDLVMASFDFDSAEEGCVINHSGTRDYAGSMSGYGQAANIVGDFKMEIASIEGGSLLSGLDSFTISYDSKTSGIGAPFISVAGRTNGGEIEIIDGESLAINAFGESVSGDGSSDWKKVVASVGSDSIKLYSDGKLVAEKAGSFDVKSILANSVLTIGAGGGGLIDNVMIFSRALTVDEINEYMAANVAPVMNVSGGSAKSLVDMFAPIVITHPSGNAFIYYTTDGSEPTRQSNRYTGAFNTGGVAHVKACAIATNGTKSDTVEAWVYNRHWAATAAEFRIEGENTVNNVKIAWPLYPGATRYEVYRGDKLVGKTAGDAVDEYDLEVNKNYTYTVKAYDGDIYLDEANTNTITTFAINVEEITGYDDNRRAGWHPLITNTDAAPQPSGYHIGDKYYSVKNEGISREEFVSLGLDGSIWDNKCTCVVFRYKESDDGINWPDEWTTLYPIFIDMRFEGRQTGMHADGESIVWSAHAEGTNGYGTAKIFTASFKPGACTDEVVQPSYVIVSGGVIKQNTDPLEQFEKFEKPASNQLYGYYVGRPFGHDSRDMVRFNDGEDFYTFSAANGNNDMLIVKYDEDWLYPVEEVNTILSGQHQESPGVFKDGDEYYIYTSTTNGWFVSQARYSSTTALDQPWSPLRPVAQAGTFGMQANGVWGYGSESGRFVHRGHGYNWGQSGGWRKSNYQIFYHLAIHDGVATGNWCYKMEYHPYWGAIAVQSGETVSLGKKATVEGRVDEKLTDNVQLQRTGVVEVQNVPYDIVVDLEVPTVVSEVNLSNDIYNGSNCGSYFKVYGSNDQSGWTLLADATNEDDDDPGYRSTWIEDTNAYRYIKVAVEAVKNMQNGGQSALWGGKPLEVAIYGKPEGWVAENYDLANQKEILVGYQRNNIDFTPYGQEPVIVNDRTLVPLRAIFETMGAEVDWNSETRTVTAKRGDTEISLAIGSDQLYVNGEAVTIDVPAQIISDRTMVPLRAIAESFGCNVNWNQTAHRAEITE